MDAEGLLKQLNVLNIYNAQLNELAQLGVLEEFVRTEVVLTLREMHVDQGHCYPSLKNNFLTLFGYNTTSLANAAQCDLYAESKNHDDKTYIDLQCLNLTVGTEFKESFADSWQEFTLSVEKIFFLQLANPNLSCITLLMTNAPPSFIKSLIVEKNLPDIAGYYILLKSGQVAALKDLGDNAKDTQFLVIAYSVKAQQNR